MATTRASWGRWVVYGAAAVLAGVGLFLVGAYLWGVVEIIVEDPADKSWLFWGLGLALFGVMFVGGGIGLALFGRSLGQGSETTPSA